MKICIHINIVFKKNLYTQPVEHINEYNSLINNMIINLHAKLKHQHSVKHSCLNIKNSYRHLVHLDYKYYKKYTNAVVIGAPIHIGIIFVYELNSFNKVCYKNLCEFIKMELAVYCKRCYAELRYYAYSWKF